MEWSTFVQLPAATIATQLRTAGGACWAVAGGGTRRAYLAQGGRLAQPSVYPAYFRWLEATQRAVFDYLFDLGVTTVLATEHIPLNRGPMYQAHAREALASVVSGPLRQAWYAQRHLRVLIAGDLTALAMYLDAPQVMAAWQHLMATTAQADGPTLVYLFRGDWIDVATEEAGLGYQLGQQLGHAPTRDELVQTFYGAVLPPLTVYVGSGRPHLRHLRPPFLSGMEDCYWCHNPLVRLSATGWRRIIYDHLWNRRTAGNRTYADDTTAQAALETVVTAHADAVLGIGYRHAAGFWMPLEHAVADYYPSL